MRRILGKDFMRTKVGTTTVTKATKYENGVVRYDTDTYRLQSAGSIILGAALLGFGLTVGKGVASVTCDFVLAGLKKVNKKLEDKVREFEASKDTSSIPNAVKGTDDEEDED